MASDMRLLTLKNFCDFLNFLRTELETFEGTAEANKIFIRFRIGAFTEETASGGDFKVLFNLLASLIRCAVNS